MTRVPPIDSVEHIGELGARDRPYGVGRLVDDAPTFDMNVDSYRQRTGSTENGKVEADP